MRIKKAVSAFAAVCLASVLLTGCGASMKTAKVAGKFGAALQQQPITSATAEINCEVTVKGAEQQEGLSTRFHTVVKSRTDWENDHSYSDIITTASAGDVQLVQNMQSYGSGESGEEVRYVHVDQFDTWVRLEDQKRVVDIDPAVILKLLEKVSEDITMETTETTVGGNTHYVLGLSFTGEEIREFAETAGLHVSQEFMECDLKGVTIPIELELEDVTFLPIRLQMKVEGINPSFLKALALSFAKGKEIQGLDLEMKEISLLITNFGYGPQNIPMLPKGAAENALDMKKVKEIQN